MIRWAKHQRNSWDEAATHVTEGDGSTSDVDLFPWNTEDLFHGNGNNGECLVELPERNLILGDTGVFQGDRDSKGRGSGEVNRGSSGICVSWYISTLSCVLQRLN